MVSFSESCSGKCRLAFLAVIYFSLFIFCSSSDIFAQRTGGKPVVGLVLSGGGACGLAHIGILKVMEEAGLKPDLITGVSMGSIIGGLYAIGYSADSLEKISKSIDWSQLFSNQIPENKVIFPEKEHFQNSIVSLPVSFNNSILPTGLINGQQIENMLGFYMWPAADIDDFMKLPIPFMCLATDLVNLKLVEFRSGYLPDAIRASMAVPTLLTPLRLDTMLLVDGGFLRNFAASEALEMGADILIGSYTGGRNNKMEEIESVTDILKQIGFYPGIKDYNEEKKLVDFLIEPDLEDCTGIDFENVDTIICRGYRAALPYLEQFRKLADSIDQPDQGNPEESILGKQLFKVDRVEITGNRIYSDNQILGILNIEPGDSVDKYTLTEKIDLLYGNVWFEKIKYRFQNRNDSLILSIDCIEKPRAMIYGSVHYDERVRSSAVIGLTVNNLLTNRSVININSLIGQYYKFIINYNQFADRNKKFGVSFNLYADNIIIPYFLIKGERGNTLSRNFVQRLSLVKRIGLNQIMTISTSYDMMNLIPDYISLNHVKKLSYNYLTGSFDYQVNTLDNKHFPNRGLIFSMNTGTSKLVSSALKTDSARIAFKENGNNNLSFKRFYTGLIGFRQYISPGDKISFHIGGNMLFITHTDTISSENNFFLLGGIRPVSKRSIAVAGFQSNEIAVRKMAGLEAGLDIEPMHDLHFFINASLYATFRSDGQKGYSLYNGYGIGAGYNSIIGPIKVGLMYGRNSSNGYFNNLKGFISFGYYF